MNNTVIISSKTGSFVDYKGDSRKYIIVAASMPYKTTLAEQSDITFVKKVAFGYAICHDDDEYNEELGMQIATNRAMKEDNPNIILTAKSGMISEEIIQAMLERQSIFVSQNPGAFIKGYDKEKAKFLKRIEKRKAYQEILNSMSEEDKLNLEYLKNVSSETKSKILCLLNM